MIYMIDNYDSFTYNLVQMLCEEGVEVSVVRNDEISPIKLEENEPEALIISPGPGNPDEAGFSKAMIRHFSGKIPILGVCLGHQAINEAFGGKTVQAERIMHGKTGKMELLASRLFRGLGESMTAGRYHSLEVDPESFPACLKVSAREGNEIMAIEHRQYPVFGVQFHPESILTPRGRDVLKNFIEIVREENKRRKDV